MPSGKVRAADVANLAASYEIVQSAQRLFDRRQSVEAVHLINVDVIGLEASQTRFARGNDVVPGIAEIIAPRPGAERCLRRNQHPIASALDGLAQYLLP